MTIWKSIECVPRDSKPYLLLDKNKNVHYAVRYQKTSSNDVHDTWWIPLKRKDMSTSDFVMWTNVPEAP